MSMSLIKARIKKAAIARRRHDQVIECAKAGLSRADVLKITGLKKGGLKMLLRREFGSASYPDSVLNHPDVTPTPDPEHTPRDGMGREG